MSTNTFDLVAISGLKRSGKGTAAGWFINTMNFVPLKFADPLKNMLRAFFSSWGLSADVVERLIEDDLKEVSLPLREEIPGVPAILSTVMLNGKTSRFCQQTIGTEWREMISTHMWVDIMEKRIADNRKNGIRTVIDDMRFPHEEQKMTVLGAIKIKIKNKRIIASDGHSSECELPDECFHIIIDNDGTIPELYKKINDEIMHYFAS